MLPTSGIKKIRKKLPFLRRFRRNFSWKEFKKVFFDRNERSLLKNPPRGYDKDHPAIDLLKLKSFESSHKIKFKFCYQERFCNYGSDKTYPFKTFKWIYR
jgi:hypothetical protein